MTGMFDRAAFETGCAELLSAVAKEEEPARRYLRGRHLPNTSYQWTDGLLCHVLEKGTRKDTPSLVCERSQVGCDTTSVTARTEVGKLSVASSFFFLSGLPNLKN